LRDIRKTRLVTLDVDCHFSFGEENRLIAAETRRSSISKRGAMRRIVARRVSGLVEDLRAKFGRAALVEESDRGIHVSFLLERGVSAKAARAAGLKILARVGRAEGASEEGFSVEVFPKVSEDGYGRGCRLPLTGGCRLLSEDLLRIKNGRKLRDVDVQELLLTPKTSLTELGVRDDWEAPSTPRPGVVSPEEGGEIVAVVGELDEARTADLCGRKLKGRAFASVCAYLLDHGIPDDASFGASGKLAALSLYAGLSEREACLAWEAFVGRGGHRSTRSQSRAGRKNLAYTFRWHYRRGMADPRVRFNCLRNRETRALADRFVERWPGVGLREAV